MKKWPDHSATDPDLPRHLDSQRRSCVGVDPWMGRRIRWFRVSPSSAFQRSTVPSDDPWREGMERKDNREGTERRDNREKGRREGRREGTMGSTMGTWMGRKTSMGNERET